MHLKVVFEINFEREWNFGGESSLAQNESSSADFCNNIFNRILHQKDVQIALFR